MADDVKRRKSYSLFYGIAERALIRKEDERIEALTAFVWDWMDTYRKWHTATIAGYAKKASEQAVSDFRGRPRPHPPPPRDIVEAVVEANP